MKNPERTLILASGSPRRTQLLTQIGLEHIVIPSDAEENITSTDPSEVVMELASKKADAVFTEYRKTHMAETFTVLGSDTVVSQDGEILGKPKDEEDAYQMLLKLQGHTHQVFTGVALISLDAQGEKSENVFYECSDVTVYPMTEEELRAYIASGEPMDKAGAYGIQGAFAAYIKNVSGEYNTIVGLPTGRVYQELKKMRDNCK